MTDLAADVTAEESLLGSVLRDPETMEALWGHADESWFTGDRARLWHALEVLWGHGEGLGLYGRRAIWDHHAVRAACETAGGPGGAMFDKWSATLVTDTARATAGTSALLAQLAYRRRMRAVAVDLGALSDDGFADIDQLGARVEAITGALDVAPSTAAGVWAEEFMAQPDTDDPWVIDGILRRGWRAVIVGFEGQGKSVLCQQLAVCAAVGRHPFWPRDIPPMRVLLVDCENPPAALRRSLKNLVANTGRTVDGRLRVCPMPGGLDLRKPRDRALVEHELRTARPDLLVIGPAYKFTVKDPRESEEQSVMAVQRVIDEMRTRHGCAVVIEHHAPHGDAMMRTARPIGSSAWLRWPELGLGLKPDPDRPGSLLVGRWRGDRMLNSWPDRLDRGGKLPWSGWWKEAPQ